MKEYWTDTILEKIVPAGTDIVREEPVRIYKADDVAELVKRTINYMRGARDGEGNSLLNIHHPFIAELERIAGK